MTPELWKISKIIPYENNPRYNDGAVDSVVKSISEFGFQQPIVVDPDGVVIAGHTRLKAAVKMGLTECPVVVADGLSPQQVKAYRLADNRTGELAEWDMEKLKEEMQELTGMGVDVELTGFTMEELGLVPPEFEPGTEDDQGKLDELSPKIETCPECGLSFDLREHGQG